MHFTPYVIPISIKGIVIDNGQVWLRKNERDEWELPGGKLDKGEQPTETVIRELREELGFNVEVVDIIQAYYLETVKDSVDEQNGVLVVSYLCKIIEKVSDFEHESEGGSASFQRFPLEKVSRLNIAHFYQEAISHAIKKDL